MTSIRKLIRLIRVRNTAKISENEEHVFANTGTVIGCFFSQTIDKHLILLTSTGTGSIFVICRFCSGDAD